MLGRIAKVSKSIIVIGKSQFVHITDSGIFIASSYDGGAPPGWMVITLGSTLPFTTAGSRRVSSGGTAMGSL